MAGVKNVEIENGKLKVTYCGRDAPAPIFFDIPCTCESIAPVDDAGTAPEPILPNDPENPTTTTQACIIANALIDYVTSTNMIGSALNTIINNAIGSVVREPMFTIALTAWMAQERIQSTGLIGLRYWAQSAWHLGLVYNAEGAISGSLITQSMKTDVACLLLASLNGATDLTSAHIDSFATVIYDYAETLQHEPVAYWKSISGFLQAIPLANLRDAVFNASLDSYPEHWDCDCGIIIEQPDRICPPVGVDGTTVQFDDEGPVDGWYILTPSYIGGNCSQVGCYMASFVIPEGCWLIDVNDWTSVDVLSPYVNQGHYMRDNPTQKLFGGPNPWGIGKRGVYRVDIRMRKPIPWRVRLSAED